MWAAWTLLCAGTTCAGTTCCPDICPLGPMVRVCTGFRFTEGPTADSFGNLYFSDYKDRPGKIYKLDVQGRLFLIRSGTGRANGLEVHPLTGEIIACEMDGRLTAYSPDGERTRVLADRFRRRRFNAPNDLTIDQTGGIYFTDPLFGARWLPPPRRSAVYYLANGPANDGDVRRLIRGLRNPNGIVLSPDQGTLYVIPSMQPEVMAYAVLGPGELGPGRVLCRLPPSPVPFYTGGDGATVDSQGNLYIATARGIQIIDPCGRPRGLLHVPERPANVAFAGRDRHTLFITARTSLYAVPMPIPGLKQPLPRQVEQANHAAAKPR